MSYLLQQLAGGAENGFTYALLGLAIVIIWKTAKSFNFAQGAMATLTAYLAWWLITHAGLPWIAGAAGALLAAAGGTLLVERVAVRPLLGRGYVGILVSTLALQYILDNATPHAFGSSPLVFPLPSTFAGVTVWSGVSIAHWSVVKMVVSLAVLAFVAWIIQRTELGLAMRAFADDNDVARLMGVRQASVSRATWILASTVVGIAAILLAPVVFLQPTFMAPIFIKGFTAAILGGFTNLRGAVAGGVLLGILEALAVAYAPSAVSLLLPMMIVFIVLLFRPEGLFSWGSSTRV